MTEEKQSAKIIKGPWKNHKIRTQSLEELNRLQDLAFIDELSENVMVNLIYTLGENDIDIGDKEFLQDIAFTIECLKSTLFRARGIPHPLTNIIRSISEISVEKNDEGEDIIATRFSINKLQIILEQLRLLETDDNKPMA
jgi:hypothetical protein